MSQFFQVHPENPQKRLITQAAEMLRAGGVIAMPTDSAYCLACVVGDKNSMERVRKIRRLDDRHNFTLLVRDLSELSTYAYVDNQLFRTLKQVTPGPYTFILKGTKEVPKRMLNSKRKTIGLRVPSDPVALALLEEMGEPLMSVTLQLPGEEYPETDPYEIRQTLEHDLDLVIDGGYCGLEMTTVVDYSDEEAVVRRVGKGDLASLGLVAEDDF